MNTIYRKKLWLFASILLVGTACDEDFLEKNPLNSVSSEIFWTTEEEAVTGLSGVYSRLQENFLGYERVYLEGLSDNAYAPGGNQSGLPNMATGNISPVTGGAMVNMYRTPYWAIASVNNFLDNVDKAPLSEEQNKIFKAEAKFIRALAYFDLVQGFGDVVINRNFPETLAEAKVTKSDAAEVYELIEADLDEGIAQLPDGKYEGHAVKASAQALKARVLITQEKWSEALPLLEDVINSGHFGLANDYAAIFLTEGQNNGEVNKEIIFSTRYLAPNNTHRTQPGAAGMDIEMGMWALMQPYEDLVNEYEMIDGLPASESPLYDPEDPYAMRDPRLDLTVKLPGEVWTDAEGKEFTKTQESQTGFHMEKYVDLSHLPFSTATTHLESDQNYVHLRYADVLLMYAEAKNEVDGPGATVYAALNDIRARPGIEMPPVDEDKYDSKETLRAFIRHERRIELALEGQRYNDLKRWEIAHIKLPTLEDPTGRALVFEQKHYHLPLPQSDIDANPNLVQNPDY